MLSVSSLSRRGLGRTRCAGTSNCTLVHALACVLVEERREELVEEAHAWESAAVEEASSVSKLLVVAETLVLG